MMGLHPKVPSPGRYNNAAKIHGCAYAGALLTRVFLAAPWWRWRLLPSLPAVRRGIQVRLGYHAPHRTGGACQAGDRDSAQPCAGETAFVGAARAPAQA